MTYQGDVEGLMDMEEDSTQLELVYGTDGLMCKRWTRCFTMAR